MKPLEEIITLDYGSGGKKTSSLIEELLVPAFANEALSALGDGAILPGQGDLVFSTDSYVISPYFFPGGDIGKLSVCGTVNDISMCGGTPKYLSLGFILEEGLPVADLRRIVASIAETAQKCGVQVVTGDTKVVERGKGDGIYINTAGIGTLTWPGLSPRKIQEGDVVLVSGTIGDHGTTVMLARSGMMEAGNLRSDCMPLNQLAKAALACGGVRVLRDPTRGGVATTLNEFVENTPGLSSWRKAACQSQMRWPAPVTFWGWIPCTVPMRAKCWWSSHRSPPKLSWPPCARPPEGNRRRPLAM